MTLFMPIQPEPASRIYSGRKTFELRKSRPPETGFVYLYETKDETASVQAIRGGFSFNQYLELPLDQLWERVGERATSRERFLSYFGHRYRYGIALVIGRVEILERPVPVSSLRRIDPDFELPRGLWTYYPVPDKSLAVRYLDSLPRERIIEHNAAHCLSTYHLSVKPLSSKKEEEDFKDLYGLYVQPNYPDSEDYCSFVLRIHREAFDKYGYFTKRKIIWSLFLHQHLIGFTVVTEKRGGSIKFGPTVLSPDNRGQGFGTAFRLLVEARYPAARKAYNTLPDDNIAALRYVLRAGYRVEAHLPEQYKRGVGELVVGKLLVAPSTPRLPPNRVVLNGSTSICDGRYIAEDVLKSAIVDLLADFYDDVDDEFVRGILKAMQEFPSSHSRKSKRVFLAFREDGNLGLLIATPKRGGALKCSPVVIRDGDKECFQSLLAAAVSSFDLEFRKIYIHVPLLSGGLIATALGLGFAPEGILREPYKGGIDMIVLGRIVR